MGGGGGGNGKGGNGNGDGQGADGQHGGDGADGADGSAYTTGTQNGCLNCQGKTAAGDPIDVVTGRVFAEPVADVELPGPLPLRLLRWYSSESTTTDHGFGPGWTHSLAWRIEVQHRRTRMYRPDGIEVTFDRLKEEGGVLTRSGSVLMRRRRSVARA